MKLFDRQGRSRERALTMISMRGRGNPGAPKNAPEGKSSILAEVTYDVIGLGDDAVRDLRELKAIERELSDKVSMCNYWANRLCCEAADRAMQVHGGLGYSRHKPFEHIYRHHRRYRITEGAEEIQMRRVAGYMFGFMSQSAPKGVHTDN